MLPRKDKHPKAGPRFSEKASESANSRRLRLAEALRENLKKRKVQMRGREAGESGAGEDGEGAA